MTNTIKAVGAFGFLVAVFMAGFGIATAIWSSSNASFQIDLRHAQEEATNARAELAAAKADYSFLRGQTSTAPKPTPIEKPAPTIRPREDSSSPSATEAEKPTPKATPGEDPISNNATATEKSVAKGADPDRATVTVSPDHTETVFDGALFISLQGIAFEGDPLHHKVVGIIGGPGAPNVQIDKADVGYVTQFKAKDVFEVRVSSATTFNATFLVTRTHPTPSKR
jgi:hypothetical protein